MQVSSCPMSTSKNLVNNSGYDIDAKIQFVHISLGTLTNFGKKLRFAMYSGFAWICHTKNETWTPPVLLPIISLSESETWINERRKNPRLMQQNDF